MKHNKHIHTAGDGRGPRDVFLNGKLIDRVMYADTRAGLVRVTGNPVKLDKFKKRILTRTLRGAVEVRPHDPVLNVETMGAENDGAPFGQAGQTVVAVLR